jgi:hypothetical protein
MSDHPTMSDQGCHDAQVVEFQSPRVVVCLMQDQGCHDAQVVEFQSPRAVVCLMQDQGCHDAQVVAPPNPEMAATSVGHSAQAAASHRFEVDTLP